MKKIDDRNIYLILVFSAVILSVFLGGISLYSRFIVEPKAETLLSAESTMNEGYLLLRNPQLFAGYRHWDSDGISVKNTLRYFDNRLFQGGAIKSEEKIYLNLIFDRRKSGSTLGVKSSLFFLLIAITGFIAYLVEKSNIKDL